MYTPIPPSIQALTNEALIITRANFNVSWVHKECEAKLEQQKASDMTEAKRLEEKQR